MPTPSSGELVHRLLQTIEQDILPLTRDGVSKGNKIFGAALLRKKDLSTVLAETNNEIENPLWHGEMHLLKRYYEIDAADRPASSELIFLTTHEPCSLCLSAITWSGFDNFYYFFSHENSRDQFSIPHDLKILKAVFNVEPGGYNTSNDFWTCHSITELADQLAEHETSDFDYRIQQIHEDYSQLSESYQSGKAENDIPLN